MREPTTESVGGLLGQAAGRGPVDSSSDPTAALQPGGN